MNDRSEKIYFYAALGLAAVYFIVLWVSAPSIGYVRDEGYYFKAATEYGRWWDVLFSSRFFDAFGDAEIQKHFGYNQEHPALVKLTQGVTYRVLHEWTGLAGPAQGFRAAGFLFGALSVVFTFLLGRAVVSAPVGLLAAALLASIPRYFFDAHLACFDVPMTAMWTGSLWAFWRAFEAPPGRRMKPVLFASLMFGLALATKLNGLFLPFVFVGVWLIGRPVFSRFRLMPRPGGGCDVGLPSIPWVLIACALIGPIVFIAHWPHLWHDTFPRIGKYLGFHLHHEHYPISYFHDLLANPPFPVSFPFVMTFYTAPSPLVILGTIGLGLAAWRMVTRRSASDALLVFAAIIPVLAIAMPSSPIFGGVKHWYNAMPSLAIFTAALVLDGARHVAQAWSDRARWAAQVALGLVVLLPGVFGSAAGHPNGIGYYNEIAGGFVGGAELGMQRGFWGGLWHPLYERLGTAPRGGVFFNRANYDSFQMYRREGVIPKSTHYSNQARGAKAGLHFEQPEHAETQGEIFSSQGPRPVEGVYQDNVTLIQLHIRGESQKPPQ